MMKRYGINIVVFMAAVLIMAACSKPVQQPSVYSGLKSEISSEAKDYNASGLAFAQKGQYQQAIDAYKKAIMKEPGYAEAYMNCSKAYYAIGNYDMARFYNMKSREVLESKATVIRESELEQEENM